MSSRSWSLRCCWVTRWLCRSAALLRSGEISRNQPATASRTLSAAAPRIHGRVLVMSAGLPVVAVRQGVRRHVRGAAELDEGDAVHVGLLGVGEVRVGPA